MGLKIKIFGIMTGFSIIEIIEKQTLKSLSQIMTMWFLKTYDNAVFTLELLFKRCQSKSNEFYSRLIS